MSVTLPQSYVGEARGVLHAIPHVIVPETISVLHAHLSDILGLPAGDEVVDGG